MGETPMLRSRDALFASPSLWPFPGFLLIPTRPALLYLIPYGRDSERGFGALSLREHILAAWQRFSTPLGVTTIGRWIAYAVLVGIVGGLGAMLFNVIFLTVRWVFLIKICDYSPPLPGGEMADWPPDGPMDLTPNLWILVIPAVGGLLSSLLVWYFAREAEGDGTDAVIEAFHKARGIVRLRASLIKIVSSSITVGSGGSAGREGPITMIGAGFGSALASLLKLSDRERRILVLAGVGAGVGSIFRAPLGGALFATEVLYRDAEFEYEALIPAFIASIVGYSVYCPLSGAGWGAIFAIPEVGFQFAQPSVLFPGLPTVAASGLPEYTSGTISGMWAPAGTPKQLVNLLNKEVARALNRKEVRERFLSAGSEVVASSPEQFAATILSDRTRMAKVIKAAGIGTD